MQFLQVTDFSSKVPDEFVVTFLPFAAPETRHVRGLHEQSDISLYDYLIMGDSMDLNDLSSFPEAVKRRILMMMANSSVSPSSTTPIETPNPSPAHVPTPMTQAGVFDQPLHETLSMTASREAVHSTSLTRLPPLSRKAGLAVVDGFLSCDEVQV